MTSRVFSRAVRRADCPSRAPDLRYTDVHGYRVMRWNPEWIEMLEHRWVMDPGEGLQVHHVNGDTADNRPENLRVLTPSEHLFEHRKHDWDEVIRLYQSGLSMPDVGRRLSIDHGQVCRILQQRGVKARTISEANRLPLNIDYIVAEYLKGRSPRSIGAELGCSKHAISGRLREAGVPARRPGRYKGWVGEAASA